MSTDFLALVYQYRSLLGYRELLGRPLTDERARRLEALEVLFAAPASASDRRKHGRGVVDLGALVELAGRLWPTSITDLGGGGVRLDPAPAAAGGTSVVVLVQDGRGVMEYRFPGELRWRDPSSGAGGVRLVGLPVGVRRWRQKVA